MEVVIVSPMRAEHAERIAAQDGVELTYLPGAAADRGWVGDAIGEGGVRSTTERWKDALERAEVAFGIPGKHGRGAGRPRPPRAAARVGAGPQRRRRPGVRRCSGARRARRAGRITVTTSSGVHAGPLAEFAILGLLAFAKDLPQRRRWQHERHWPEGQTPVGELRGQTLLLVGVGAIGTETARLAGAFGMHVLAVKRTLEGGVPHVDELHPVSELRALVGRADAIVVTLPAPTPPAGSSMPRRWPRSSPAPCSSTSAAAR